MKPPEVIKLFKKHRQSRANIMSETNAWPYAIRRIQLEAKRFIYRGEIKCLRWPNVRSFCYASNHHNMNTRKERVIHTINTIAIYI